MDYSILDRPEVLKFLFYPRTDAAESMQSTFGVDVLIPVEANTVVGAKFHLMDKTSPNILFFHGNGEIVSDYDDLGPLYNRMGINFLPVDYRGYGRSTGKPTVTAMLKDCHTILEFVTDWLKENGHSGPLIVMGRSLGSASALELAADHNSRIAGLIIESGFAYAQPLLELMGVRVNVLGFAEQEGFRNIDKIRLFNGPLLVIHGELDEIIPFSDAEALYDNSAARRKTLKKIPNVGHNDLFSFGLKIYMATVKAFLDGIK